MFNKEQCENDSRRRDGRIGKMRAKFIMFDEDIRKEKRVEEQLCKSCYYVFNEGWAGQAFTEAECEDCGQTMIFATTNIDHFCLDCARKNNVCKHCGCKMD